MNIEIKVPSPGESITEVEIAQWLKNDGDYVMIYEEGKNPIVFSHLYSSTGIGIFNITISPKGNIYLNGFFKDQLIFDGIGEVENDSISPYKVFIAKYKKNKELEWFHSIQGKFQTPHFCNTMPIKLKWH